MVSYSIGSMRFTIGSKSDLILAIQVVALFLRSNLKKGCLDDESSSKIVSEEQLGEPSPPPLPLQNFSNLPFWG